MPGKSSTAAKRTPVQARSRKIKATIMEAAHNVMRGAGNPGHHDEFDRRARRHQSRFDLRLFPNKEAIIAEIYEEKLAQFRNFLEKGTKKIEKKDWRKQLAGLLRKPGLINGILGSIVQ